MYSNKLVLIIFYENEKIEPKETFEKELNNEYKRGDHSKEKGNSSCQNVYGNKL